MKMKTTSKSSKKKCEGNELYPVMIRKDITGRTEELMKHTSRTKAA